MNNTLAVSSRSINLDLDRYIEGRSMMREYLIKDSYSFPASKNDHGQYSIIVQSPIIRDGSDLGRHIRSIKEIAQRLTVLTKCVLGEALNTSPWEMDLFTKKIELIGKMPVGWESNYDLVQKELDRNKRFSMQIEVLPHRFIALQESPFKDYINALKHYPRLQPIERDLLQVLNDADLVSFTGRYMLLSKALEMVSAMCPPKKGRDERIRILLPELYERFKGTTLSDLMNLANNRKETRHYVDKSSESLSHPSMSEEELKMFYSLTNQLCLNIVRRSLGLGIVDFCPE